MKRPETCLFELAADNSKLFKESYILKLAEDGHDDFFKGVRLALDQFLKFGVKKIPERTGPEGKGVSMADFEALCTKLVERKLTGGDAQTAIATMMKASTNEQWNWWYRRILAKDLKAGFSEETVNKAVKNFPQYKIPVFTCQLAKDGTGKERGKKIMDIKLDGARILSFLYPDGTVIQTSRNGLVKENFPGIVKELKTLCQHLTEPIMIDGEMMSASFQDLMKQFNRKTNVDTSDAVYYVFDIITEAEFKAGKGRLPQKRRRVILDEFIDENQDTLPHVAAVAWEEVDLDTPEGQKRFKELNAIALEKLSNGKTRYEGLMLKNPDGLYQCKRTDDWLKVKPVYTVTLPISHLEEGKPGTKYVGMMGAAFCAGHDGDDPRYIEVSCGGGWSDDQRERYWKMWLKDPSKFKGVLIDIDCDGVTQDQHGNWSLRFPRFNKFRGFVPGEKI